VPKTMNFSSPEAYHRWLAYDKMHVHPGESRHPVTVKINGRPHRVCHQEGCRRLSAHTHGGTPCCGNFMHCGSAMRKEYGG
jgi:hypothetical protein